MVDWNGNETTINDYGLDRVYELTCHFHKRRLTEDQNVFVREGDFILYNKVFKIKSLLQQINIFFSKSNYELKSNILIGSYLIDTNSRTISKNNVSLKLTEKEIDLLIFLNNSKRECSSVDLQKNVWKQSGDLETHTVETHIYRLRKKFQNFFNDNKFIISDKDGYKIS